MKAVEYKHKLLKPGCLYILKESFLCCLTEDFDIKNFTTIMWENASIPYNKEPVIFIKAARLGDMIVCFFLYKNKICSSHVIHVSNFEKLFYKTNLQ